MATNQTTNYQLNQWEPTDAVQRVEFNQDNAKMDAALKSLSDQVVQKANQSALNTLISAVNQKAEQEDLDSLEDTVQQISADLTKITFGTYAGDGAESRTINLGFTPKAVFVIEAGGRTLMSGYSIQHYGGLAFQNTPATDSSGDIVQIVTNGFKVFNRLNGDYIRTNYEGLDFHYIAFS